MSDDFIKQLKDSIAQFEEKVYENTCICFIHPETLLQINLDEVPSNVWFISNILVDKWGLYKINDGDFKRFLYEYYSDNEKEVIKGRQL